MTALPPGSTRLTRRGVLAASLCLPAIRAARAAPATAPSASGAATNGAFASAITLLVGAAAGSGADQVARAFAPFLERHLPGAAVAILNRPGQGGALAFEAIADAKPDGLVLGWVATPSLPARTVDSAGAASIMDRLRLIGAVQKESIAIVSPAESPLASVQDIVTRSSENAEAVPLGTPPAGSPPHLAALRLQALSGTPLNIVAFPSPAAARQAALAGTVAAAALGLGDAITCLRNGRLAGLGLAARTRSDAFPDMPVLSESGLMLSAFVRRGLAAPASLSAAATARLAAALAAVVADPEFIAQGDSLGFLATWLDGASWTDQTTTERTELARLWKADPWPIPGVG
jgi:tripartite-type tricarboxylate transporter receptor subunit TctC